MPPAHAAPNLQGRILIDVNQNGEAWYVLPTSYERVYLGRPNDAFQVMRELGLGIRSSELAALPPALTPVDGEDSDGDGLVDSFEEALGTDPEKADTDADGFNDKAELASNYSPFGPTRFTVNKQLLNRMKGHILLQVEGAGQAWYVNPVDSKRYYLGRPSDAFRIMRELGLGISHANLQTIPVSGSTSVTSSPQEKIKAIKPLAVEIRAKDFSLAPYSTRIDAGKPIRLTFKNNGTSPHNVYIEESNIGTPTIAPGESASIDLSPLEPGIYTLFCAVDEHRKKGMEAYLKVL